jgi:predicted nucleotidyltransferase component of viral defense system
MLNRAKHQLIMGRILRDIYADVSIAPLLGLKGGTCAYFFYGLPRFSVDLDFDLLKTLDQSTQQTAFATVKTIFFLLSYGDADHNIKIEVNIRTDISGIQDYFELKEHLGISMLAAKPEYLFAVKLAALTARSATAMRDIYDIWYFAKNNWDINAEALEARTGKKLKDHLADCVKIIERVKDNQILQGLGEL